MKRGRKKIIIVISCFILIATMTANATENTTQNTTKKIAEKNDVFQTKILLSLWIGRISNVKPQGGWTPTIHFHAISVIILTNQHPWIIWLRNTDEDIRQDGYRGWIGPITICALVGY